jgi:pyrroloquinoline quinone (PQQ) biosynthesis protein C
MAISETLKQDIEAYATRLRSSNQLFRRARHGNLTPTAVVSYIANLRFLVQHTDVNLKLAQERAEQLGRTQLARFFQQKRREEVGHDRWADNDIALLQGMFGVRPTLQPSTSIANLLEYLRAMITEEPTNYLAYILFVEYVTVLVGPEWLRLVEDRCGIPMSAMTVVGNHIELDKDHVADGLREIDQLIGEGDSAEPLRSALYTSMEYFEGFCSEMSTIIN